MSRQGPPKHQNKFVWNPEAFKKKNETEVGGKLRPYSEITGVCPKCRDQIQWKRKYGKYKALIEPSKCQKCTKRNVRQAYHNLCTGCAKDLNVCAKCSCHVARILGRDLSEVEAEKKELEEAIKHARERDRRTILRAMNKGKTVGSAKATISEEEEEEEEKKVEKSLPAASLEKSAELSKEGADEDDDDDEDEDENEDENEDDDDDDRTRN